MTEEELEALAAAAGVEWISGSCNHNLNKYMVYLKHYTGLSYGETREEAMNHYWNRYINGEIMRFIR